MRRDLTHPYRKAAGALGLLLLLAFICISAAPAGEGGRMSHGSPEAGLIYDPGTLPPRDSELAVHVGDLAPDFTLPAISGGEVTLSDYRGEANVVLSFVPAAWTPVCSGQWPAYRLIRADLEAADAVILGITVDNIPTLYAWVTDMDGLFFPVLSDFWPHGEAAARYGLLRTDGMSERATLLVDKEGILRYVEVHDINASPDIQALVRALEAVAEGQASAEE
jgi:peroxiredoxin (alkyl hydroperoxide reductase subunit C)